MINWIIQTDYDRTRPVAEAVVQSGASVVGIQMVPFTHEVIPDDWSLDGHKLWNEFPKEGIIIPYGSTALIKLAQKKVWRGLAFNHKFNVSRWNHLRDDMLNQDASCYEIRNCHFSDVSPHDLCFVRPFEDLKAFPGQVMTYGDLFQASQNLQIGNHSFEGSLYVAVSKPKIIHAEWRWFIVDRKVISGALYRDNGKLCKVPVTDPVSWCEAQTLADVWLPHETCVMDLAITPHGMKVIKFNCLNASGFYNHDIPAVVKAVNAWAQTK